MKRVLVFCLLVAASCEEKDQVARVPDDAYRYFLVSSLTEQFIVRTSDPAVLHKADSLLALPAESRNMLVIGPIDRGDDGYNKPWNWHFKTNQWGFAELAIELCDGMPSYVNDHLEEWLNTVGSYCPWSSRLERELLAGEVLP
jgi:hypothetical protein